MRALLLLLFLIYALSTFYGTIAVIYHDRFKRGLQAFERALQVAACAGALIVLLLVIRALWQ